MADLPQVKQFIGSVADLLRTLNECGDLPEPVMVAAAQVRLAAAAMGGPDIAPPPAETSDEDCIRDAMTEAMDHPGRIITR